MHLTRLKPFTLMAFLSVGIIVVILLFTFCSFDVNADEVIMGYNSTRKYATDAKKLQFSVDTFREVVKVKVNDEQRREEAIPSNVETLGQYGTLLEESVYEAYTATLSMSSDKSLYPVHDNMVYPSSDRSLEAVFASKEPLHYVTENDTICTEGGGTDTEIHLYGSYQCALFANTYVNQVAYRDYVKSASDTLVFGAYQVLNTELASELGTCWKADSYVTLSSAEEAKSFFYKVTPGTFVRCEETPKSNLHSYIILGADDDNIIIYDANVGTKCAIYLHKYTWEYFASQPWMTGFIRMVITPPNTSLPQGCLDNFGSQGAIIGGGS